MKQRGSSPSISELSIAPKGQHGYDCAEVDEYFSVLAKDFNLLRAGYTRGVTNTSGRIRSKNFTGVSGGYLAADVDKALDRVEDRFAEYERSIFINSRGRAVFDKMVAADSQLIMGRLNRPDGHRFRRPRRGLTKGYYVRDVDALCQQLKKDFTGATPSNPALIRSAVFRSATGNVCYEETQVDAFLDRCIKLILNLR